MSNGERPRKSFAVQTLTNSILRGLAYNAAAGVLTVIVSQDCGASSCIDYVKTMMPIAWGLCGFDTAISFVVAAAHK